MSVLLTIAAVHFVGLLVPGPNVLTVSQTAIGTSRRAALAAAAGVATAALLWAAAAAAGLALLLASVAGLGTSLRVVGAALLIVLGVRMIASRHEPTKADAVSSHYFAKGMLVNLTNPKSLVYYTSVFTALIPADASPFVRIAAVAIVVGESASWHSLLAIGFSRARPRRLYERFGAWVERTVGGIFVVVGGRLLWDASG